MISGDNNNVVAHHLNGYRKFIDEKYDLNNGVPLTNELHKEFHRLYDKYKGDCTEEQFNEFYKFKTGKIFNKKEHESQKNNKNRKRGNL